ncbi:FecR family protein [Steroidobacter sp.]|uniref:FecR family protein n=1 Tax=Steroidobacter sp. TaxID=1978227 RepID=UPI001A597586|nr:FecR domain-containing protein [Steroidobacter sp.]MBL8267172.1 FecR domain-containing protein [Steroidobacter sp.]
MNRALAESERGTAALAEATAWQVYFESSGRDSSDEFVAWVNASPDNAAAWEQVRGMWGLLDEHETSDAGAELRRLALADADAAKASTQRWWSSINAGQRIAAAVAVVTIVGLLTAWGLTRPETYSTSMGERRVVALSDDSRITLDSDSEVQVRYSKERRALVLSRGQARFDVAHDTARPFSVTARGQQVIAVGTSFNVDTLGPDLRVTLLEGRVVVAPQSAEVDVAALRDQALSAKAVTAAGSAPLVELAAGEQLTMRTGTAPAVAAVSAAHVSAWESGHLVFDGESLASVIERMSHYSAQRLLIADPRVAELRITGFFNAGDTAGFISTITEYLPVRAMPAADGAIALQHR